MSLGIKEETVSPYKDEISSCFLWGDILSSLIFKIKIEIIRPMVKNQNVIYTLFLRFGEAMGSMMD
jgi:hypothetical protein